MGVWQKSIKTQFFKGFAYFKKVCIFIEGICANNIKQKYHGCPQILEGKDGNPCEFNY